MKEHKHKSYTTTGTVLGKVTSHLGGGQCNNDAMLDVPTQEKYICQNSPGGLFLWSERTY